DGTNKMHLLGPNYNAGSWAVLVGKATSPTAYSANDQATSGGAMPLIWLTIQDDGTNVSFGYSYDGVQYVIIQTTAKSAAWLGASGYTNICFFLVAQSAASQG